MQPTTYQIYQSILLRAADEWGVEYEDVEKDLGQQYDPVVRFLAGAVASEMELVYQRLHDTEQRLQERLARILLPEYCHLPVPAHALATATPSSDAVMISETTSFIRELGENEGDVAFSPVFPARLLPAALQIVALPSGLLDARQRAPLRKGAAASVPERAGRILIGVEMKSPEVNWQDASLYFELRGLGAGESEKARFFAALAKSTCLLNGREMKIACGLPENPFILEDYLNGNERLQTVVRARYEQHFLTFQEEKPPAGGAIPPQEFLPRWFIAQGMAATDAEKQLSRIEKDVLKRPLIWLEVQLAQPVDIVQLTNRLIVRLNVFPVVNRRLCGAGSGDHHYLPTNAIKWVHLQPEEPFVSIRRVYEEKPPGYQVFTFKPFADFREESKPGYTIRIGGVGRWDDFNAWKRMAYLVSILQENYGHEELILKAASSLSLEEIHHLLGKRIAEANQEQKPTTDIYVLLHTGITSGMRVRVEYWTSIGEAANGIAAKTMLRCLGRAAGDLEADSIMLVTATEGGGNPLAPVEQLDAMRGALLSRKRIVTREDVIIFCKNILRDRLANVTVADGVGTDPRFDFGMTRRLEVKLTPAEATVNEDWEAICQQVQKLLEKQSSSNVPVHVVLAQPQSVRRS